MAETNPCKCAPLDSGLTKSTAASYTVQVCNGDELKSVSASDFADYIISVIYGDEFGNPPSGGCYNVCFDSGGNRSIETAASSINIDYLTYTFQEEITIFPNGYPDPDDAEVWGSPQTRLLALTQPPAGFAPTHVKLRIWGFSFDSGSSVLRDANNNRIFYAQGYNSDDDHSSFAEVSVPVQLNVSDEYEVYITGSSAYPINIKQIGYEKVCVIDENGVPTDPVGGTEPSEPAPTVTPEPYNITHITHTYVSGGDDQTIVEWYIDDNMTSADNYDIFYDFGETILTQSVPHIVGLTSNKQRHTVDWTSQDSLRCHVMVSSALSGNGPVETSNFGSSDTSIPVSYQSSATV